VTPRDPSLLSGSVTVATATCGSNARSLFIAMLGALGRAIPTGAPTSDSIVQIRPARPTGPMVIEGIVRTRERPGHAPPPTFPTGQ
jgi:hypothetical protein